jgi:cellulose synthase/poly-beta-1,6-N-acetylglucosamine synthase-like glycosyltransferase
VKTGRLAYQKLFGTRPEAHKPEQQNGSNMEILRIINYAIFVILVICYSYQFMFIPVSLISRLTGKMRGKKRADLSPRHRYAVLICARNEEAVIGELLDSIEAQTYPAELVTTFVLADNCTDSTADTARAHGAVVYERFNTKRIGKGYALDELLEHIDKDYGDIFDGYMVFDADNLLMPDYIERINETFEAGGCDIITSYRNTKNYADNWISAGYGLNFLRETRYLNHPRSLLGTSCVVSGTGFMFSRRIRHKISGWPYHSLCEDIEFTADQILDGEQIGFCPAAEFYDEQPVKFTQSWRQRMRWAKGYLQMYRRFGKRLFLGMLHGNFACFDMTMSTMPAMLLSIVGIAANVTIAVAAALLGDDIMIGVMSLLENAVCAYLTLFAIGLITTISEWKHIRAAAPKKLFYTLTFPFYMFTYIPISFAAFFARVTWKPIEHNVVGRAQSLLTPHDNTL